MQIIWNNKTFQRNENQRKSVKEEKKTHTEKNLINQCE